MVNWSDIDTILLDMDGTLLDLRYDDVIWNDVVPREYARRAGITHEQAWEKLYVETMKTATRLDFYDVQFWIDTTGLDLESVHREQTHLLRYREGVHDFLEAARASGRGAYLATNAHPISLDVKDSVTNIRGLVDGTFSSHTFAAPKEDPAFWRGLRDALDFDPARTLFIDDNEGVLSCAEKVGIGHLLSIRPPNSAKPARDDSAFAALGHFHDLLPIDSRE